DVLIWTSRNGAVDRPRIAEVLAVVDYSEPGMLRISGQKPLDPGIGAAIVHDQDRCVRRAVADQGIEAILDCLVGIENRDDDANPAHQARLVHVEVEVWPPGWFNREGSRALVQRLAGFLDPHVYRDAVFDGPGLPAVLEAGSSGAQA